MLCFRRVDADDPRQGFHMCMVSDPLHTGDHQCCCGFEWPVEDEQWQETRRALDRDTA